MALTASAEEKQGTKRTIIMILVILIHVVALWGLQNGLARRLVEILPNDIKAEIIKDEKKEEPPPPPPPPPDQLTPPPPFVPPVEVAIAIPTEAPPTAITTTSERPPVTAAPIMTPPAENIRKGGFDPKNPIRSSEDFYPQDSIRAEEEGVTTVEVFVATNGHVTDVRIKTSSGFDRLDQAAIRYAKTWRMLPQTRNGVAEGAWMSVPIRWRIANKR